MAFILDWSVLSLNGKWKRPSKDPAWWRIIAAPLSRTPTDVLID
jgi:hypothetical protein